MTGALSSVEQALVEHVERGEQLDLAGDSPVDLDTMRSWDESRTIRASVVRDILRGRLASDPDPHGLRLRGARISGRIDLENITSRVSLELEHCFLPEGVIARDADLTALWLHGCQIEHPSEPAVDATRLTSAVVYLVETSVEGHGICAVDVSGARLGELHCTGARLRTDSGPALRAEELHTESGVWLREGFHATGAGAAGAVNLMSARLSGSLECAGARLLNETGPALRADNLRVERDVQLYEGFDAIGAGRNGAVNLLGAHIGGLLDCLGATLRNDSGPALVADGIRVDLRVFLGVGFTMHGAGEEGSLRLSGAHLGGLQCDETIMRNDSGPALIAESARVDNDVIFNRFKATGAGPEAAFDLNNVEVRGSLYFKPSRLEHVTDPRSRISLDQLVYRGLPLGIDTAEWLKLLREGTPSYTAQPYQHLAAAHRSVGHDREARRVLMAQRREQIRSRALTGHAERAWARFTGLVLGYGYQPWRALLGLLAVLATGAVLAVVLGGSGLVQVRTGAAPAACPVIDRIAVGLELGAPLLSTPARIRCEATNTSAGQALTITGWALRLMAWAFATLFIAGFTGAVRKS